MRPELLLSVWASNNEQIQSAWTNKLSKFKYLHEALFNIRIDDVGLQFSSAAVSSMDALFFDTFMQIFVQISETQEPYFENFLFQGKGCSLDADLYISIVIVDFGY